MAVIANLGTFYPRRLSMYVPAMQYASDVNMQGDTRITFGAPVAANATYLINALSVAAGATIQSTNAAMLNSATVPDAYGRNLQFVLSGAGTGTVTVDGYDYLGQPMSENFALNGTTPVLGKKAFKYIRQVTYPTVGAVTMNMGIGIQLGLPYKAGRVLTEENGGAVVASLGTLTGPDVTDPATATTGDTRGTYACTTTMNGSNIITATFEFYADVNASNNGGLHGIAQFAN